MESQRRRAGEQRALSVKVTEVARASPASLATRTEELQRNNAVEDDLQMALLSDKEMAKSTANGEVLWQDIQ